MTTIESFVKRLEKIGIHTKLIGNFPWIYLDEVNGKKVEGKLLGNHGFTIFFQSIRYEKPDTITDISKIFNKIRETLKQ